MGTRGADLLVLVFVRPGDSQRAAATKKLQISSAKW